MAVVGLATFVIACTCATLGLMVSLSFLIFHIYHRQNKLVKMTSPYMNMLTSAGAFGLSVVCFLYGMDFILDSSRRTLTILCQIRLWLLVTALTLTLGPVCTKAWRVHSIFKYSFAKKIVIRDRKLVAIITGLLLVDVVLMTLWQVIDPVTSNAKAILEEIVDIEDSFYNINSTVTIRECTCSKLPVWITFITLWKVFLFALCLVLAWKTRNVSVTALNDAVYVFSALFTVAVIAFFATFISISLQKNMDAVYIIINIAISSSVIVLQLIMFLPRVVYWWKTPDNVSPRISVANMRELASAEIPRLSLEDYNGNTYQNDGLMEIVEENKTLKESIIEKEEMISALQSHIDLAKEKLTDLPTDIRHDSGYSVDNISECHDDIYDTLRSPDQSPDRSVLYRVQGTPRSARSEDTNNVTDSRTHSDSEHCHQTNLKYIESQSVQSIDSKRSFVHEFTDLRNSIVLELETATHRNSDDLDSETEWLYESNDAKELAGSIVQSYNLGNSKDTETYIQSLLPVENSVIQIKRSKRLSSSSVRSLPSSENVSTRSIESDSISGEIPSCWRGSGTPNSQQHAEILRYYSYRHINDGLKRFKTYRVNRECRPPSFRYRKNVYTPKSLMLNGTYKTTPNQSATDNVNAIYSVPNVVQKPPRTFKDSNWPPKDSFV